MRRRPGAAIAARAARRAAQTGEEAAPRVDTKALTTVRQNRYSVPVALAGLRVPPGSGPGRSRCSADGREVARHERLSGRFGISAQLDHYLELLARKPGALARSWRCTRSVSGASGPGASTSCGQGSASAGASEAARQMVDVLLLCREHGPARVELAVRGALAAGAHDGRAVGLLARRCRPPRTGRRSTVCPTA